MWEPDNGLLHIRQFYADNGSTGKIAHTPSARVMASVEMKALVIVNCIMDVDPSLAGTSHAFSACTQDDHSFLTRPEIPTRSDKDGTATKRGYDRGSHLNPNLCGCDTAGDDFSFPVSASYQLKPGTTLKFDR